MVEQTDKPPPKKRGRKSKKTLEEEPYNYVCQGEGPLTVLELINFLKGILKLCHQLQP